MPVAQAPQPRTRNVSAPAAPTTSHTTGAARPRAVYFCYTNPAGYPPLLHSARILADRGWEVVVLGTGAFGAAQLEFPPHPRITVRRLPFQAAGIRQKLHYLRFCAWVVTEVMRLRPRLVYASDLFACPPALVLSARRWWTLLYHEHDDPNAAGVRRPSAFLRAVLRARTLVARRADVCIVPQRERAAYFAAETGRTAPVACVWNCPARDEALVPPRAPDDDAFRLLYHGSIVPTRLPLAVVDALCELPERVRLRVIGYAPVGHAGYVDELRARAAALGVAHRVEFMGAIPLRAALLEHARECQLGLAFMPAVTDDVNQRWMVGASNKPFDYMACGLPLLVSDLPDWRATYVDGGYGVACDPGNPTGVAAAVRSVLDQPDGGWRVGEAGRRQILTKWNYERQFAGVLTKLSPHVAGNDA